MRMEWGNDTLAIFLGPCRLARARSLHDRGEPLSTYNLHSTVLYAVNRPHEEGFSLVGWKRSEAHRRRSFSKPVAYKRDAYSAQGPLQERSEIRLCSQREKREG